LVESVNSNDGVRVLKPPKMWRRGAAVALRLGAGQHAVESAQLLVRLVDQVLQRRRSRRDVDVDLVGGAAQLDDQVADVRAHSAGIGGVGTASCVRPELLVERVHQVEDDEERDELERN
jgi:hypothetical protein